MPVGEMEVHTHTLGWPRGPASAGREQGGSPSVRSFLVGQARPSPYCCPGKPTADATVHGCTPLRSSVR